MQCEPRAFKLVRPFILYPAFKSIKNPGHTFEGGAYLGEAFIRGNTVHNTYIHIPCTHEHTNIHAYGYVSTHSYTQINELHTYHTTEKHDFFILH